MNVYNIKMLKKKISLLHNNFYSDLIFIHFLNDNDQEYQISILFQSK